GKETVGGYLGDLGARFVLASRGCQNRGVHRDGRGGNRATWYFQIGVHGQRILRAILFQKRQRKQRPVWQTCRLIAHHLFCQFYNGVDSLNFTGKCKIGVGGEEGIGGRSLERGGARPSNYQE